MIRTFDLINRNQEVYTLSVANKHTGFLYDVDGLGMEHDNEYQRIGTSFETLTDNVNQAVIAGTVRFFNPYAYQEYLRFSMFCQDKDLKIHYRTPAGEFYRDGSVTKIEKSENNDSLKVRIEFTAASLWYREIEETITGTTNNRTIILFTSDSAIQSPCTLIFQPAATITAIDWWQRYGVNNYVYGALSDISVTSSQSIVITTETNPYQIYRGPSSPVNYYGKSDFSTERFIYIHKGDNMIGFEALGTLIIKGKILYETV